MERDGEGLVGNVVIGTGRVRDDVDHEEYYIERGKEKRRRKERRKRRE